MKIFFSSNVTPTIAFDTNSHGPGPLWVKKLMAFVAPMVTTDNKFVPIKVKPYGEPIDGEYKKNLWVVGFAVGGIIILALYGLWRLIKG